jgi:hypothetical protein
LKQSIIIDKSSDTSMLRKKQPNSLVDVAEEPREQITIVKDVAAVQILRG